MASCTEFEQSIAHPVVRQNITSEWSPKIDSACVAMVRAVTWKAAGVSSPAILFMLGIIKSNPCEAVNVVASDPVWRAPCTAPAAPPSLCISMTWGMLPHALGTACEAHSSAHSPIGDEGVMG